MIDLPALRAKAVQGIVAKKREQIANERKIFDDLMKEHTRTGSREAKVYADRCARSIANLQISIDDLLRRHERDMQLIAERRSA